MCTADFCYSIETAAIAEEAYETGRKLFDMKTTNKASSFRRSDEEFFEQHSMLCEEPRKLSCASWAKAN